MRKGYYIMLGLFLVSMATLAQTKVTFRVNMKNEIVSPNGVHIPGSYQQAAGMAADWSPEDSLTEAKDPDNDKIYELQVTLPPGNYEYIYINNNDWIEGIESVPLACQKEGTENRELKVGSTNMVLDVVCFSNCGNCQFQREVIFLLMDSNLNLKNVKFKGEMSGGEEFAGYDDGTHGDKKAGDKIFSANLKVKRGEYSWSATNNGFNAIKGIYPKFKMDSLGKVTGDTLYRIPKLGALIDVTFLIDMTKEKVDTSGVYISGNFMENMQSPIYNWDKDTLKMKMQPTIGPIIYGIKLKLYADNYVWKVWNGKRNPPNEDQTAEKFNFTAAGCGEPDGKGGHNRILNLRGKTTAQYTKWYYFNSCDVTADIKPLKPIKFGVNPNPATNIVTVIFKNNIMADLVTVVDFTGRTLITQKVESGITEIDVNTLSKGIYFVNVFGKNGMFGVQKLVKN